MRNSSVSRPRKQPQSPAPAHPFFATRTSQPTSPVPPLAKPQVFDKLLKETFTSISQLAGIPQPSAQTHLSIISTFERLSNHNVFTDLKKSESKEETKSPNSSPGPFHSTAASNSIAPNSLPDQYGGVSFPTTPAVAISGLGKYLTNTEVSEILGYKTVYYLGMNAEKVNGDLGLPNCGYDDERDDYKVVLGDHLEYRYEVLEVIGMGAFGKVLRCFDHKEGVALAVKVIRNAKRFHKQASIELQILQMLKDKRCVHAITLFEHFKFRNHICMTFELLDRNLYDYLKHNHFRGFPLLWVRSIAIQLIEVLIELKQGGIIHCDLKPENVLFVERNKGAVKVIDFGSACFDSVRMFSYIQSRFYRAPEVILGLKYSFPIDMWSLGCLLSELYTGRPLFPGETETDQLLWIMSALGYPPSSLLSLASKKNVFFNANNEVKVVPNSHGTRRMPSTTSIPKLIPCTDQNFIDFVRRKTYSECLEWSPNLRLTPEVARSHPFLITPPSPEVC